MHLKKGFIPWFHVDNINSLVKEKQLHQRSAADDKPARVLGR